MGQSVLAQTDYFREWLICGSFPNGDMSTRLTTDYLDGESKVVPVGGSMSKGKRWVLYRSAQKQMDFLDPILGLEPKEHCVVYACVFVHSPKQSRMKLLVGSDDGIVVWVNGTKVHSHDVLREVSLDNDEIPVTLHEGWNTLLFKVANNEGGFGLAARFGDGEGRTLMS